MDFIASQIPGSRFETIPLNLPEFESELANKRLDFLITNPLHYIIFESKYGASRVATLVKAENGEIVNQFGGVIFTRADRENINGLSDLRGKRLAATDKTSFAAYVAQADLLQEHGIDPEEDVHVSFLGFPQDLNVHAVLERRVDAGFVRSGLLESMAREGKIRLTDIKLLTGNEVSSFPFMLSTALFPEWPFAAMPHVSIDVRNQVVAALMRMPPDAPAAKAGRYYRWSTPVEYLSVQRLMQRRHIYPFDREPEFTLYGVVQRYSVQLVVVILIICLVVSFQYVRTWRLNRQLLISRRELSNMAHHDALTGLPNRNLLDDRLERLILQAERTHATVAVCMLDLDGFKPINDSLGHDIGDEVLKEVAQRIGHAVRASDTVARFGGDEFVILVNEIEAEHALTHLLNRVIEAIAEPMPSVGPMRVHASLGVSIWGLDASDATTLMRHADEAMYRSKAAGGNRFTVYSPSPV
jgi:diguanylate cyclase (GGDEF)-like protein